MKYVPVISALSVAILYLVVGVPSSTYSKVACIALGLALLYFGYRATASGVPAVPAEEPERPLDNDLVTRILDNLKSEPSEQLREMLAQASGGNWSPEALQAARQLLDQRSNKVAAEPVYRTVPRAEKDQSSREREAVAPGFSRHLLALDVGGAGWGQDDDSRLRWYCPCG